MTCAECKHGSMGVHSGADKCLHPNNTNGFHPYALRHDETLCGAAGAWSVLKPAPGSDYSAAKAEAQQVGG